MTGHSEHQSRDIVDLIKQCYHQTTCIFLLLMISYYNKMPIPSCCGIGDKLSACTLVTHSHEVYLSKRGWSTIAMESHEESLLFILKLDHLVETLPLIELPFGVAGLCYVLIWYRTALCYDHFIAVLPKMASLRGCLIQSASIYFPSAHKWLTLLQI